MGKFNEIQDEKTQSWGGNSFTTTVKEDTVEFDSAKDKFTFKDAVDVPSLSINGESVSAQVQADWNQNDSESADYVKNRTHYAEVTGEEEVINDTFSFETSEYEPGVFSNTYYSSTESSPFVEGAKYDVSISNKKYQIVANEEPSLRYELEDFDDNGIKYINISIMGGLMGNELGINIDSNEPIEQSQIIISLIEETVHQLDDKFISDNIARMTDIPEIPTLPDIAKGNGNHSIIINDLTRNAAISNYSYAEGYSTTSAGLYSHSEGYGELSSNMSATYVSSGKYTVNYDYSFIKNGRISYNNVKYKVSDAIYNSGTNKTTLTIQDGGIPLPQSNINIKLVQGGAYGDASHSEGYNCNSYGTHSHSEGFACGSCGNSSHSEGYNCMSIGDYSHSEGFVTMANGAMQHTFGSFNIIDETSTSSDMKGAYVEIVGNGNPNTGTRSNARTLDWDGNEMLSGTLTIGGASGATIKVESGALKVSFDGGTTWLTISAS